MTVCLMNSCQNYRISTVYIWFWPTLQTLHACTQDVITGTMAAVAALIFSGLVANLVVVQVCGLKSTCSRGKEETLNKNGFAFFVKLLKSSMTWSPGAILRMDNKAY